MYFTPEVITTHGQFHTNVTIIKTLGDQFKCVNLNSVRKSGIEVEQDRTQWQENTEKLDNNVSRAKTKIMEYALCNLWDWFITLTLDGEKYDRHNLKAWREDLTVFIKNYNRYCSDDEKVTYVLIPEQHKDGAWHMHGLLKGIKEKDMYVNEYGYKSWRQYDSKFGYMSMGRIKNKQRVARYITKYISKEIAKDITKLGDHLYYCSRGLAVGEIIFRGHAICNRWQWEHPNGFMRTSTYNSAVEMSKYFKVISNL